MKQISSGLILACAVVGLSGCMAQASLPHRSEIETTVEVAGRTVQVEAEGVAYMGDKDTLEGTRQRAWDNALQRASAQGASIYVEQYHRSEFGALTDDVIQEVIAGTLSRVQVISEGLDGNAYRLRIRGDFMPEDVDAVLARRHRQSDTPS